MLYDINSLLQKIYYRLLQVIIAGEDHAYLKHVKDLVIYNHVKVVVVALLFYVHGKHLRSCREGQLT